MPPLLGHYKEAGIAGLPRGLALGIARQLSDSKISADSVVRETKFLKELYLQENEANALEALKTRLNFILDSDLNEEQALPALSLLLDINQTKSWDFLEKSYQQRSKLTIKKLASKLSNTKAENLSSKELALRLEALVQVKGPELKVKQYIKAGKEHLTQTQGTGNVWACRVLDCKEQAHILMIVADDLNDMIKPLDPTALTQTPNINKLAQKSTVFTQAYASATQCNPSRFSLLTGLNPSQTKIYNNLSDSRKNQYQYQYLPAYLKDHGYQTIGIEKIFHGNKNIAWVWDDYYDFSSTGKREAEEDSIRWSDKNSNMDRADSNSANKAAEILSKELPVPTFLAIGFHSPHLPWSYPRKYFDLYPLEKIHTPKQPFYDLYDVPQNGSKLTAGTGTSNWWLEYHEEVIEAGRWKEAIRAYMAGISRLDDEIGTVLDALYKGPNADNTIVILWSDHGFHLGEKQHWSKHTLWEKTTHVPLIISQASQQEGQVCNKIVSLLDVYPTLVEMSSLAKNKQLQGNSLVPLLVKPEQDWDQAALTTMNQDNYSVRKSQWRYTRYADGSEELYDHEFDPNEFHNLSHLKELKNIKKQLAKYMH